MFFALFIKKMQKKNHLMFTLLICFPLRSVVKNNKCDFLNYFQLQENEVSTLN